MSEGSSGPPSGPPLAALFDLDGTLIDREPLMLAAVCAVLQGGGDEGDEGGPASGVGPEDLGGWVGRAWQDVYRGLGVHALLGCDFDTFMGRVLDEADRLLADGFDAPVLAGGAALVRQLHDAGVPVAIVTGSTRREVLPALALLGIEDLLTAVIAADDYAIGKPDPSCYLLAAERLDVAPQRCIVFEDSEVGVRSAIAAGMWVVATAAANPAAGHPSHQDLSAAHLVVDQLTALTPAILGLAP